MYCFFFFYVYNDFFTTTMYKDEEMAVGTLHRICIKKLLTFLHSSHLIKSLKARDACSD